MAHKTTFAMATVVCMSTWMAGERATAEVVAVAGNGFEIRETAYTAAAPDKVYAALLTPARWWSSEHTFSGSAANLVLDRYWAQGGVNACQPEGKDRQGDHEIRQVGGEGDVENARQHQLEHQRR